jgi:predicted porin
MRYLTTSQFLLLVFFFGIITNDRTASQTFLDNLNFYSSIRLHIATYDKKSEMQDNGSRIGFKVRTGLAEGINMLGRVELAMRLIQNSIELNLDNITESDPWLVPIGSPNEVFSLRLAYLGFDFKQYGIITAGKQWSVYYDLSSWTDLFYVFGASASGTFVSRTDGGFTGTGRADQALIYRNSLGPISFGLQTQFKNTEVKGFENFGLSLIYTLFEHLSLGSSFNGYRLPPAVVEEVIGADDKKRVLAFGGRWSDERLYLAAHLSFHNSNEFVNIGDSIAVAYDANGYELLAQYAVFEKFKLHTGFNYLAPKEVLPPADPDLQTLYYILGATYFFHPNTFLYMEYRIDDSIGATGTTIMNIFTLGVRFDWDWDAISK